MSGKESSRQALVRNLHEVLFSVNIAFAAGYALMISGFVEYPTRYGFTPVTAFKYFFLRAAARTNMLFRLPPRSMVAQELTFIVSVFSLALLVLVAVRFLTGTAPYRLILNYFAGITAILAVPASLIYSHDAIMEVRSDEIIASFWSTPAGLIVVYDILLAVLLVRHGPQGSRVRFWFYAVLLTLHYFLWSLLFWSVTSPMRLTSPAFFVIVLAGAGLAWIFYGREPGLTARKAEVPQRAWRFSLASGLLASGLLLVLWLPAMGHRIEHAKNMQSLTIKLVRPGFCFVTCPSYQLTIHGNGMVEYTGIRNVGVAGPVSAAIRPEQLMDLLQEFDRVGFFSLQDVAFDRCPDAATVSISVAVDGNQKTVTSDAHCTGARSGPQTAFVQLANRIDSVVGSDRWVQCDGPCANSDRERLFEERRRKKQAAGKF